jgi:hypothetical protein
MYYALSMYILQKEIGTTHRICPRSTKVDFLMGRWFFTVTSTGCRHPEVLQPKIAPAQRYVNFREWLGFVLNLHFVL